MSRLGIEFLTVLGLPPIEHVRLAGKLGCQNISFMLSGSYVNPHGYPDYDLRTDSALRRDFAKALRDHGVQISLGEGFVVQPDQDVSSAKADLDMLRELGAKRINMVSMDPDLGRTWDQFARLTELAAEAGMEESVLEFAPIMTIQDLPMALDAIAHVGRSDFRLLIDTMHLARTGGTAEDLRNLPPEKIGYVQICDAPTVPTIADYMQEAMTERLTPGEGEIPLADMLAALPKHLIISLEVPQVGRMMAGDSVEQIVGDAWQASRNLLDLIAA